MSWEEGVGVIVAGSFATGLVWIVKRKMTEAAVAELKAGLFQFDPEPQRFPKSTGESAAPVQLQWAPCYGLVVQ